MAVKDRRNAKSGKSALTSKKASKKRRIQKFAGESKAVINSRIRAIGNSKGIILNGKLLEAAGITDRAEVAIHAKEGEIRIVPIQDSAINNDIAKWDALFKAAISKGAKPEKDLFGGLDNSFDEKEW